MISIYLLPDYYKHICRQSGIQLSLGAEIGEGFKFEHFGGIVIGSIKIGKNCNIFHNVTIGYAGRWQNGGVVLPLVIMW